MKPDISIIVPIYNVELYLERCILSILNQTFNRWELILVNDGSLDASLSICKKYLEQDKRIRIIDKENGGLVSARKAGLKIANGLYTTFVDSDDYIDKIFLDKLYERIVLDDSDMVHTGMIRHKKTNTWEDIYYKEGVIEFDIYDKTKFIRQSLFDEGEEKVKHNLCGKLFKTNLIRSAYANVPDDAPLGEDAIAFAYFIYDARKVSLMHLPAYHYILREGSYTNTYGLSQLRKVLNFYEALKILFIKKNVWNEVEPYCTDYFTRACLESLRFANNKYEINAYLWPDVECLRRTRIVIYGAGIVGQSYFRQLSKYQDINIVLWCDKCYKKYNFDYNSVKDVSEIENVEFDYLIIAIKNKGMCAEIKDILIQRGIEEDKIVY